MTSQQQRDPNRRFVGPWDCGGNRVPLSRTPDKQSMDQPRLVRGRVGEGSDHESR